MVGVVDELRENDPARTRITIHLAAEPSDTALAQALEQNPFVKKILLDLEEEQGAEWNSLLRVIAMRANLETVALELDKNKGSLARQTNAQAKFLRSTLRAIQQNTAIRNVALDSMRLPTDISTFVDNASSITSFVLYECDMAPGEREQGARNLAAALQRNKNIQSLRLTRLDDIYIIPILEGLRSNVFLKSFAFTPAYSDILESDAVTDAFQHLLESTSSIQRIELRRTTFNERQLQFPSIAQAITSSECISELKICRCEFPEQSSIDQLQSILQNKRNLTSLCLESCNFGRGQLHEDIISVISRPGSLLQCFEFQSYRPLEEAFPGVQYKNLLRAIEKSKLERFRIQSFVTLQQLQTLTQSIPAMKLKELEILFFHDEEEGGIFQAIVEGLRNALTLCGLCGIGGFGQETIRQDLLHAVKNNFSLRSLKAYVEANLFVTRQNKKTLAFYANRNEQLDQFVNNPESVKQRKLWPEALGLAQRAGPDALFRGLRLALESDYVVPKGGRKRKRPSTIYAPS